MNPQPVSASYILRVRRRGRRLLLELVDLRSGQAVQTGSLRGLWQLLRGLRDGLH